MWSKCSGETHPATILRYLLGLASVLYAAALRAWVPGCCRGGRTAASLAYVAQGLRSWRLNLPRPPMAVLPGLGHDYSHENHHWSHRMWLPYGMLTCHEGPAGAAGPGRQAVHSGAHGPSQREGRVYLGGFVQSRVAASIGQSLQSFGPDTCLMYLAARRLHLLNSFWAWSPANPGLA